MFLNSSRSPPARRAGHVLSGLLDLVLHNGLSKPRRNYYARHIVTIFTLYLGTLHIVTSLGVSRPPVTVTGLTAVSRVTVTASLACHGSLIRHVTLLLVAILGPMLAKDGLDLLLHEGPGHVAALQGALVPTGTVGLEQGVRGHIPAQITVHPSRLQQTY